MSIQDELVVRDRLTSLLDDIEAKPAPVGAAIRSGKTIRARRRLAVAGGLAASVAAGALVPGLLQHPVRPLAHERFQVSVHAPGKNDPANLIASGTANGRNWRAVATGPRGGLTVNVSGFPLMGGPLTNPGPAAAESGIVAFSAVGAGAGSHAVQAMVSAVSPGITLITMTLANGAVLNLHPVNYGGTPLIALVLPHGLRVIRADAYSRTGEVAYAIPFYYRGLNTFGNWLRPSQAPHAVESASLPVALNGPGNWTESVRVGPWGACVVTLDSREELGEACASTWTTRQLAVDIEQGGGPLVGVTRPDVAFFELTMSDGRSIRVSTVHIGHTSYYAVMSPTNPKVISWAAYDRVGHRLGGGQGVPGAPSSGKRH